MISRSGRFNRWVAVSIVSISMAGLGGCMKTDTKPNVKVPPGGRGAPAKPRDPKPLPQVKKYDAVPLPTTMRVDSSAPRVQLWNALTDQQKNLATHLIQASQAGRDILFFQNHRHGLAIKQIFEEALSARSLKDTKALLGPKAFAEFLVYATKFLDAGGPYGTSNRKYVMKTVTSAQIKKLAKIFGGTVPRSTADEIASLLTDPTYEVIQYPEDESGTDLGYAGGNLYDRTVTAAEVVEAFRRGLKSGVNCRIVRDAKAGLRCQTQSLSTVDLPTPVRASLMKIVHELELAIPYALTDHQRRQFELMISYLEKGDEELFREYNREWVKDRSDSPVDFMVGFVEVYEDFRGKIASWESYVQLVDPKTTEQSLALARHAQEFENAMPYGTYKKTFPKDYSPPALMVYYFQEVASMRSAGYNLPNYDDIRKDVGAKNIIKLPLPGEENDPNAVLVKKEWLTEYMPASRIAATLADSDKSWRILVLLHEIIGHGSGTYDESKYAKGEDPVQALGSLGSALEEQRADLTALVFASDPNLVSVGLYKDQAEAGRVRNSMYDFYTADFLRRLSKARTVTEAHQRGHWLFINQALEQGSIRFVSREGSAEYTPENAVLEVVDYEKFYTTAHDLLAELQRIKAVRDEAALKKLFAQDAPLNVIDTAWAKGIIQRGNKLAVNQGSVEQPWRLSADGKLEPLGKDLTLEGIAPAWDQSARSFTE